MLHKLCNYLQNTCLWHMQYSNWMKVTDIREKSVRPRRAFWTQAWAVTSSVINLSRCLAMYRLQLAHDTSPVYSLHLIECTIYDKKSLAIAKRPCNWGVLCLRLKSSQYSCLYYISDLTGHFWQIFWVQREWKDYRYPCFICKARLTHRPARPWPRDPQF